MPLEHIVGGAIHHLAGRLIRRALLALVIAAFAIVAIFYFTIAGMLALEAQYGALYAHLIVAAIYTAAALTGAILWMVQRKPAIASDPAVARAREMQLVMLLEAAMLGYGLARRGVRAP